MIYIIGVILDTPISRTPRDHSCITRSTTVVDRRVRIAMQSTMPRGFVALKLSLATILVSIRNHPACSHSRTSKSIALQESLNPSQRSNTTMAARPDFLRAKPQSAQSVLVSTIPTAKCQDVRQVMHSKAQLHLTHLVTTLVQR